jgi:hypothetical protein
MTTDFGAISAGLVAGLVVARAIASGFGPWLFEVKAGEPALYLSVAAILAAVGAAACSVPAARAAKADPLVALASD